MAITRLGSVSQNKNSGNTTTHDLSHTVTSGTELLLVYIGLEGAEDLASTPFWNSTETMTLIHDTGNNGSNANTRSLVYALKNPTATSSTIDVETSSTANPSWVIAINLEGVDTTLDPVTNGGSGLVLFRAADTDTGNSNATTLSESSSTAGNAAVAWAHFQGYDGAEGNAVTKSKTAYTWLTASGGEWTGTSDNADFGLAAAWWDEITADGTSDIEFGWAASDQCGGILVEVVAASGTIKQPDRYQAALTGKEPDLDHPQPVIEQVHHRVYANDNANADSATALSTEDARYTANPGTTYLARIKLECTTANYGSYTPTLRYRVNAGAWTTVPDPSDYQGDIRVQAGLPTDGATLTEQLTTEGTYQNGWYEDSSSAQPARTINVGSYEFVWSIMLNPRNLIGQASDTIDLQVMDGTDEVDTATEIDVLQVPADFTYTKYGTQQHDWRWYAATGNSDPDLLAAREAANTQTTILTSELDTAVCLRFHYHFPGGMYENRGNELYFRVDGGTWTETTATSNYVRTATGDPADSDPCNTELLTNKGGTFSGIGQYDEGNSDALYTSSTTDPSNDVENMFCIQFLSANFSGGELVEFQLWDGNDSAYVPLGSGATWASAVIQGDSPVITFEGDPPEGDGELDLAGKIPVLNLTLSPTRYQLALAGKVPVLNFGFSPARHQLALAGKVPTLEFTFVYDEAVDSVEIIEKTPILAYAIRDPPIEELDLQGKVPTVALAISPDREQLDLSGKAPTVHWTVTPAREELDLTGKTPVLDWLFTPGRYELALAGKTSTVHWTVTPGRYELALTGYSPEVPISVPEGSLSLTGYAPLFGAAKPPKGALTLAGKTPVLNLTLSPARYELNLAGKTSTVHWSVTPGRYELALTGKTPDLDLTLSPARDELDLTGKLPSLDLALSPARHQLSLAGKTPSLPFYPAKGTLALTGHAPSITPTFYPDEVELNLTGKAPVLFQLKPVVTVPYLELRLKSFVGLYLEGYSPTVIELVPIIKEPDEGTLTLTGKAPTVHWSVTPARDELDLTGKVPSLGLAFTPDRDQLNFAGKIPTVHWSITPGKGTLTLTGKIPSVPIVPGTGSLTLTGQPPSIAAYQPGRAELSLSGKAPDIEQTWSAAPTRGEANLTGKTPDIEQTWSASPVEGSLSLTGQNVEAYQPTDEGVFLIPHHFLTLYSRRGLWLDGYPPTTSITAGAKSPPTGSISLTGDAPTLTYSWTIEPARGQLTLTGKTPFLQEFVAQPDEETLDLTGYAPKAKGGPPITAAPARYQLSLNYYAPSRAYGFLLVGKEVTIETVGVRSPDTVDLTLTSYAPELDNSTPIPVVIPVPEGPQLSIQTYWPALGIVNPNQDSTFGLLGYAPISWTTSPTFFPGRYSVTINEQDLISDVEGLAPEALLFLNGKTLTIKARTLIPGAGSLSLGSTAPEVIAEKNYVPVTLLSLTGAAVYTRRTVSPSTGTITVSSIEPPIVIEGTNWKTAPDKGSLALLGYAPARNVGQIKYPAAYDVSLTGYSIDYGYTQSIEVSATERNLTGYVPELFINLPITIPKQTLKLQGKTFKLKLKRIRKTGARTRLISLTTEYAIELLYR